MEQSLYEELKQEREKYLLRFKWKKYLARSFAWMLLVLLLTIIISYFIPVKFCRNYHITMKEDFGIMQLVLLIINLHLFCFFKTLKKFNSLSVKVVMGMWFVISCLIFSIIFMPLFNEQKMIDFVILGAEVFIFFLLIGIGVICYLKKDDKICEVDFERTCILLTFLIVVRVGVSPFPSKVLNDFLHLLTNLIIGVFLIKMTMTIMEDSKKKEPTHPVIYGYMLHTIFLSMIWYL